LKIIRRITHGSDKFKECKTREASLSSIVSLRKNLLRCKRSPRNLYARKSAITRSALKSQKQTIHC
jgi:hypothetical protein